jgi:hemerythrin-like domain-containing protein/nucleotide-binding universal stress UspA family protein
MYRHLLVPINNTDSATATIGQAVEFARSLGARITFFYAQIENAVNHSPSRPGFSYTDEGRAKELLTKAESAARALGVPCSSKTVISNVPYSVILATAQAEACDLIFMAKRERQGPIGMMPGTQSLNVLANAEIPVLFSIAGYSAAQPRAIATIRDEHRSLAAVLHAWAHLLQSAKMQGTSPNVPLMSAMIQYIRNFSIALHDTKEEAYLFSKLRERTSALNAELDELERQHERGKHMVADLADLVERHDGSRNASRDLEQAVKAYANFIWEHLGREEGVILPAAQRFLTDEDWYEINCAFSEHQNPLFGSSSDNDADFQLLFSLLAKLAAASTS